MAGVKGRSGGVRPRRAPQSNNTSGLLGVWFRWAERSHGLVAEACVVVGAARYSRTLTGKKTARAALRELLQLRDKAGLPVCSLHKAVRAFNRWRTNQAAHYLVKGRRNG